MRQEIDRERKERESEIRLVRQQNDRERKDKESEIRLMKQQIGLHLFRLQLNH